MTWFLVLFACGRGLNGEQRCDGLDDDGDGVVDEEVLAFRYEMPVDMAGAPEMGIQTERELTPMLGVTYVRQDSVMSNGYAKIHERAFDGSGRLISEYLEVSQEDGGGYTERSDFEYEQGQQVYARYELVSEEEDYEDGWEVFGTLGENGKIAEEVFRTLSGSSEEVYTRYQYDAQDRLVVLESRSGERCDAAYWQYPSELVEKHVSDGSCEQAPSFQSDLSYVHTRDEAGHLVSVVSDPDSWVWTWQDGVLKSRAHQDDGENWLREYEFVDGRFVSITDDQHGRYLAYEYNEAGVMETVELSNLEGPVQGMRTDMQLRDREGSQVLTRINEVFIEAEGEESWWLTELDLDDLGNLVSAYEDLDATIKEHTWSYDCMEAD